MADILLKPFLLEGVAWRVTCNNLRIRRLASTGWILLGVALVLASAARAQPFRDAAAPQRAPYVPDVGTAPAHTPTPALDELVYTDGDRLRGHFVEKQGDVLVFKSERFGLLHVPATDAHVILAKPPAPEVAATVVKEAEKETVAVERWPFSPLAMAAALKDFFGSWHGRFSVGAEVLQDSNDHNSVTADARLARKWKRDEVELSGRYEYSAVNQATATDTVKGNGVWRHDFPGKLFSVYRPTLEWNRAFYRGGQPADYVLLQQEVGAGINLWNSETRKLRTGISENLFDTWVTPIDSHVSQTVESAFAEFEAKLPWRVTLTNRGVWYYSIVDETEGWENRFEVNKKLTETLTMGVRHETRHNNPDVRSADYQRLRVLFGFDF